MYKFGTKKNREDVVALRWPKACLCCGTDVEQDLEPLYAIVGKFHEEKQTQVLVKLPGFFYMCNDCTVDIDSAVNHLQEKQDNLFKLAESLQVAPWTEFIELEKDGCIKIPEGVFKEKLQKANPDACTKSKENPFKVLKGKLPK